MLASSIFSSVADRFPPADMCNNNVRRLFENSVTGNRNMDNAAKFRSSHSKPDDVSLPKLLARLPPSVELTMRPSSAS